VELEAAVRRMFLNDDTVRGLVGDRVFKHRLETKVDGTGDRAVVVARNNGWATPDPVQTQEYPILGVKFYADPDRTEGEIVRMNGEDKALAVYRAANGLLHARRGFRMGAWGSDPGLMVVTVARWAEPVTVTERDRHGMSAGDPLGDAVYVYVEYALQVVH